MIPFSRSVQGFIMRSLVPKYGSALPGSRSFAPFIAIVVSDLYLNRMRYPISNISSMNNYTTVGSIGIHEIEIKDKIVILVFAPKCFVFGSGKNAGTVFPNSFQVNGIAQITFEHCFPAGSGSIRIDVCRVLRK